MEIKIGGKRSRRTFAVFAVIMLLCLIFVPSIIAAAETMEDVYDIDYEMGWVQIPYGNGIDDDNDGTIDEDDGSEPDVVTGTGDYTTGNNTVIESWYNDYLPYGVIVGGSYEELWRVTCSENVSINPIQTCYAFSVETNSYENITNTINAVTYYMNIPASKLMNGASEFWYRSPLLWDDTVYKEDASGPYHYVNIYDEDNNLVYATPVDNGDIPDPTNVVDDSGYERLYYKINMNFQTDNTYRIEEYVKTIADNPINSVDIFMARFQDIADDGELFTYTFWGNANARKVATECSWSMVFTLGKGLQGGEKIIFGGQNYSIETQEFPGDDTIDNTGSLQIIFPLRTTRPLNITVSYRIYSGGDDSGWLQDPSTHDIVDACGTLIYAFNVTDPNATAPNTYRIRFNITNLDEDYNGENCSNQAMTFYMFPNYGDAIVITNGTNISEVNFFACHIEVANEKVATQTATKGSDIWTMLVGFAVIIVGIILVATVIGAGIGVPILFGGITIASGTALAIGAGAVALGSALYIAGIMGYSLRQIYDGIASGAVRLLNAVVKGIQVIGGAIWNGLIYTIAKIVELGSAMLHYGAMILNIVWEIFAFLAFILVLYCWNWFLVLMKYIAKGDIESAFAAVKKPIQKYGKKAIKYTRYIKKERKREGRAIRAEGRQERRTQAYEAAQARRFME
jgi:hypothetical protein